jgi:hypothetical protein
MRIATKHSMPSGSEQSTKQSTEWNTLTDISLLKLNQVVMYEDTTAVVTFVDPLYCVITKESMQYGIIIYPQFAHRVKVKQLIPG